MSKSVNDLQARPRRRRRRLDKAFDHLLELGGGVDKADAKAQPRLVGFGRYSPDFNFGRERPTLECQAQATPASDLGGLARLEQDATGADLEQSHGNGKRDNRHLAAEHFVPRRTTTFLERGWIVGWGAGRHGSL